MKNLIILVLLIFFSLSVFAQNDLENIQNLLNQGITKNAISLLEKRISENPKDAESWNLLGLAYLQEKNYKQSQKAFEKAIKLNPKSEIYQTNLAFLFATTNKISKAEKSANEAIKLNPNYARAYYIRGTLSLWKAKFDKAIADADIAIKNDSTYSNAYLLKTDAQIYKVGGESATNTNTKFLEEANETLEQCLHLCKDNLELVKERLEAVKVFNNYFNKTKDKTSLFQPESEDPSITPLRILSKPKPGYTDSARQSNTTGTIRLAIYFSSKGTIDYILVLKPLQNGLTENAIKAARGIKFEPQMKDGKPVSVIKIVEYSFTIY